MDKKRVMYIANTRLRYTNILISILLGLIEMGYYVQDIDMLQHRELVMNPMKLEGGRGPVEINYNILRSEIDRFDPFMIVIAGGGLTFSEEASRELKERGIILLGITLSDPDVFDWAKNYAQRFSFHATNAKIALQKYIDAGITNTYYLPFGIDSRFFVPTGDTLKYSGDVVVMGHFQPSRLPIVEELRKRFNTKIYGSRWPYADTAPVAYPEWLNAVQSGKIVVDFPGTRAGYFNVKVRLFEVAAAGTLLITEYLDEIGEFFEYDKEIIGYRTLDELYAKVQYYLNNPAERMQIAKNAQIKCAQNYMWKNRFSKLFSDIGI